MLRTFTRPASIRVDSLLDALPELIRRNAQVAVFFAVGPVRFEQTATVNSLFPFT